MDHKSIVHGSNRKNILNALAALACDRCLILSNHLVIFSVRWPHFLRANQMHPTQSDVAPELKEFTQVCIWHIIPTSKATYIFALQAIKSGNRIAYSVHSNMSKMQGTRRVWKHRNNHKLFIRFTLIETNLLDFILPMSFNVRFHLRGQLRLLLIKKEIRNFDFVFKLTTNLLPCQSKQTVKFVHPSVE